MIFFQLVHLQFENGNCWSQKINTRLTLDHLGLTNLRYVTDRPINFDTIKTRLRDQFIQEWNVSINNSFELSLYCGFKQKFEFEAYLELLKIPKWLTTFLRFRLNSHDLEIETGRYGNVPRNKNLCNVCRTNLIENEYHFLLCYPKYADLRRKYLHNLQ